MSPEGRGGLVDRPELVQTRELITPRVEPFTFEDLDRLAELDQRAENNELTDGEFHLYAMLCRLRELALKDSLTGLHTRRYLELAKERERQLPRKEDQAERVMLVIDINDFRNFNERYTHLGGDKVLQHISAHIESVIHDTIRDEDFAVRYAGDEFCVVLHHTTKEGGKIVAERLYNAIAFHPVELGGEHVHVTVSIGYALANDSLEQGFAHADQALLETAKAKKGQEMTVASFDELRGQAGRETVA